MVLVNTICTTLGKTCNIYVQFRNFNFLRITEPFFFYLIKDIKVRCYGSYIVIVFSFVARIEMYGVYIANIVIKI